MIRYARLGTGINIVDLFQEAKKITQEEMQKLMLSLDLAVGARVFPRASLSIEHTTS